MNKSAKVVLVDDDKSTTDFLSSRLDQLGVESVVASNGVTAFEIAKSESPAVIVTDYYMPNGDAEYLLGKLRQTQETKHIPVIVHTGRKVDEHVIKGARVVRKSHHGENLFHAMKRYCGFVDPVMHFKEPVSPA
jgi:CheY-like chemotaxis protein